MTAAALQAADATHRRQARGRAAVALLLAALSALVLGLVAEPRRPVGDEYFYLSHAVALHETGTWGMMQPDGTLKPSLAAPAWPAVLAAAMAVDDGLAGRAACWVREPRESPACDPGFGVVSVLTAVSMGLCTALVFTAAAALLGGAAPGLVGAAAWLASGVPERFAASLLTEVVTVPLVMAASLLLVAAVRRRRGLGLLALSAACLGAAALGRPSYLYGGVLLAGLLPVLWWWAAPAGRSAPRACLAAAVAFAAAFAVLVAPWKVYQDRSADGDAQIAGYASHTLLYRTAYNAMTPTEYAAAWLYWLPDFGDDWARGVFGDAAVARFDFTAPDGFYVGEVNRLFDAVREATGISVGLHSQGAQKPGAPSPMHWVIGEKVLGELHRYAPTTLVLAWRGAFPGKIVGLLGLLALASVAVLPLRPGVRRGVLLLALPAVLMTLLHAAVSLNIPRYNIPLLLPYAVAIAAVAQAAWRRIGGGKGGTP